MKQAFFLLTLLLASFNLFSQTNYSGFIDNYPIELVTNIFSDGAARAIYAYSNFDEPIVVTGSFQKNNLTLFEKDKTGKKRATLIFDNFTVASNKAEGTWTDLTTGKQHTIRLTKMFDIGYGDSIEWTNREILQPVSLPNRYFKLIVSKVKGNFYATVTGVKIIEKKTDRLIQKIDLDCQLMGLDNVSIGDYNFDGITDFSVFERSYAGPNTSRLYFLCGKRTNQYFDSGFSGTSLEFNSKTKRIFERNQCCAGTVVMTAEYKVANNKMVLVKQHCYKWDDKKQELTERKMKECK